MKRTMLVGLAAGCVAAMCHGEIGFDGDAGAWVMKGGPVEYRLRQRDGSLYLAYLGPAGQPAWKPLAGSWSQGRTEAPENVYDLEGRVEGQAFFPADLELVASKLGKRDGAVDEFQLVFRHRQLPLEIEALYQVWAETGVLTRRLTLHNRGQTPLRVEKVPSLAWRLPPGRYQLEYLWGGWGQERQLATEELGAGVRAFVNDRGRSSNGYSPWFCLRNRSLGVRYMAQLAYSGNWEMSFEQRPDHRPLDQADLRVELGMRFDSGGSLLLGAGEHFALPAVAFTASDGDLDDAANQMHRYQRQFVIPRRPGNEPPLVQFNSWYPFPGKMNVGEMKRCAGLAAELGAEVFVLDAGWFNKTNWDREIGDWEADAIAFPNGIEELAQDVHGRGMKFGIWVEIENLGEASKSFAAHPDWCLAWSGRPLTVNGRHPLNFAKPEVRAWARSVLDRLVQAYKLDWVKIDYNIDVMESFDPVGPRRGDVLYRHLEAYYQWLDELRAAHPGLVIENCSSGGLRFDLGLLAHTHTTWLSDEVRPRPSVQLAYGATLEFTPEVCNHWMVGDRDNGTVVSTNAPGWWDFMFRVPMNGQFGISSRVVDWSPELRERARQQVALYKGLRPLICGADVYHLTAPPAHENPTNWMALQYVSLDRRRSAVLTYRLGKSRERQVFKLRGLDSERLYQVRLEGREVGVLTGRHLAEVGVAVHLEDEWRSAILEAGPGP
jgi:alpha-galactosidase